MCFLAHFTNDTGLVHFSVFVHFAHDMGVCIFRVCPTTPMTSAGTCFGAKTKKLQDYMCMHKFLSEIFVIHGDPFSPGCRLCFPKVEKSRELVEVVPEQVPGEIPGKKVNDWVGTGFL